MASQVRIAGTFTPPCRASVECRHPCAGDPISAGDPDWSRPGKQRGSLARQAMCPSRATFNAADWPVMGCLVKEAAPAVMAPAASALSGGTHPLKGDAPGQGRRWNGSV